MIQISITSSDGKKIVELLFEINPVKTFNNGRIYIQGLGSFYASYICNGSN